MFTVSGTRISPRILAVALIGGLVVVTAMFVAAKANGETAPCRLLSNPAEVTSLSEGTLRDLRSDESHLDPEDLTTPTEQEARAAAAVRPSDGRGDWVCRAPKDGEVVVIRRSKQSTEHCYGTSCPSTPYPEVWVTCFQGLDLASGRKTFQGGCIGFPLDHG